MTTAERIARAFHDTYERLAPAYAYETREASRTHWALVPAENKKLMIAVVQTLLDEGVITEPHVEHAATPRSRRPVVYRLGWDAALVGKPREFCAFHGTAAIAAWNEGYTDALAEREKERDIHADPRGGS